MNFSLIAGFTLFFGLGFNALFAFPGIPGGDVGTKRLDAAVVDVTAQYLFIPQNFDDNDSITIVISGDLPSPCHSSVEAETHVDAHKKLIQIFPKAIHTPSSWCETPFPVRYAQEINLKTLVAGDYTVEVVHHDGSKTPEQQTLPIRRAKVSKDNPKRTDDHFYAPVKEARLERVRLRNTDGTVSNSYVLHLIGILYNTCMRFKDEEILLNNVEFSISSRNIIEVLPKIEIERERACVEVIQPFDIVVPLNHIAHGRYLIHVRALSGSAINRVEEL